MADEKLKVAKIEKKKKLIRQIFKRRRFVFTPDIVSLLFKTVATKKQAKLLTKKGRKFTGFERRFIVRTLSNKRRRNIILRRLKKR